MEEGRSAALGRLRRWAALGTLPHALILSGGTMPEDARFAAAAFQCRDAGARPCGVCRACRKVLAGRHPDVVTAEDAAHKTLPVEAIRGLCADAYVRPNEGERKVYLFPDCERLTEADQNVLLKLVEEGPPYAAFLFCAAHPERLLKTLRSRCAHLALPSPQEAEAAFPEAEALCRALLAGDRPGLAEVTAALERRRLSREALSRLLEQARERLAQALCRAAADRGGGAGPSLRRMAAAAETLRRCRRACAYNVSPGHVLGALTVEWEAMM